MATHFMILFGAILRWPHFRVRYSLVFLYFLSINFCIGFNLRVVVISFDVLKGVN